MISTILCWRIFCWEDSVRDPQTLIPLESWDCPLSAYILILGVTMSRFELKLIQTMSLCVVVVIFNIYWKLPDKEIQNATQWCGWVHLGTIFLRTFTWKSLVWYYSYAESYTSKKLKLVTVRLTSIYLEILKIENFLSEPTEILYSWLHPKSIYPRIFNSYLGSMRSVPKKFRSGALSTATQPWWLAAPPNRLHNERGSYGSMDPKCLIAPNTPIEAIKA